MKLTGDYTTTEHDRYTEYTVAAGSTFRVTLETGDVFADTLIDVSAEGAGVQMFTYPNRFDARSPARQCAIRNVGVRGAVPEDNGPVLVTGVSNTAIVEGVYLGDGMVVDSPFYGDPAVVGVEGHLGRLTFDNVYVAGFPSGAFSMTGRRPKRTDVYDGDGTYHWSECYVEECAVAGYRVEDQPGRHSLENCHADLTGQPARAVWNRDSTVDITGGEFDGGGNGGISGHTGAARVAFSGDVNVDGGVSCAYDGAYTTGAEPAVPSNCPTTALEAARGTLETPLTDLDTTADAPGGPGSRDHHLFVTGETRNTATPVEYTIRTTGGIETGQYRDPEFSSDNIEVYDTYYEVTWSIADWRDSYQFDGELFYVECSDPLVDFHLDDEEIDPTDDQYSQEPPSDGPQAPKDLGDPPEGAPWTTKTVSVPAGETRRVTFAVDAADLRDSGGDAQ